MTSKKELFATSKNGIAVYYDPVHSHAATHFADSPQIVPIVKSIIETKALSGKMTEFETDTGTPIGNSDLVKTDETDDIVYAIRKNRDRHARFTKSKGPQPSSLVTIRLDPLKDGSYELYSAWIGPVTPPFPNSRSKTPESLAFWSEHALAWGTQEIQPGTETSACPW